MALATQTQITKDIAVKVLEVVDAGLVRGKGVPKPGGMCVEAAVCYAMGLPHGDDPECVSRPLRSLKIKLNDSAWSSNEARAKGLRRLAVVQLGSRGVLDDNEFIRRVVDLAIRKWTPSALRAAASAHPNPEHQAKLEAAAVRCEAEGTKAAANAAAYAADAADAAYAADAADAAYAAYAADAAAYAADAAAYAAYAADAADAAYAADAADAAAYAAYAADAADAAYAADAAAYAANAAYAADAAAYAANAANAANAADAADAARDEALSDFAEDVVQVLAEMKAPGCEWLVLTEPALAA